MTDVWRTKMDAPGQTWRMLYQVPDGIAVADLAMFLRDPPYWLALSAERLVLVVNVHGHIVASYHKGESLVFLSAVNAVGDGCEHDSESFECSVVSGSREDADLEVEIPIPDNWAKLKA